MSAQYAPLDSCDVLIVGGGSAGIATAASLLRRRPDLDVRIVEPSEHHYYQPGWTMVGAGVFTPERTRRRTEDLIPHGAQWVRGSVAAFDPIHDRVELTDGRWIGYRMLVAAPGLKLDWGAIPGLPETLGRNNVTSNYGYETAPYTWNLVQAMHSGRAIFTQPVGVEAAVRYDADCNPMRMYLTDHPGSGDVWASAHDMARFLAFHMGTPLPDQKPILSMVTRLEMQRPASAYPMPTPPGAPRRDIGANWIVTTSNGHPQIWHSGGQPGVSSVMAFFPEQKLAFVLLANSSAPLGPIGQAIRETFAPELLEQASEPSPLDPEAIPFLGRWVGSVTSHAGEQPISLSFQDGGEVTIRLGAQATTTLVQPAFESGAFTGRFAGSSDIPEAARAAHNLSLKLVPVEGELVGQLVAQGLNANAAFMLPSFVRLRPEAVRQ